MLIGLLGADHGLRVAVMVNDFGSINAEAPTRRAVLQVVGMRVSPVLNVLPGILGRDPYGFMQPDPAGGAEGAAPIRR